MSLLLASSAAAVTGCSAGDEMLMGLGSQVEAPPAQGQANAQMSGPSQLDAPSNALIVTPRQRAYLDALDAAGVTPSSDLTALSIGSYVCQARAAKQTDQAVWDFVAPLVRNDVADPDNHDGVRAMVPSADELRSATSDYIRVAIARLC
ncbi:hypothetical protein NGTWS0302_17600 [Mycolicibacterium cyprinidarum]|uniref:DUF732 domain-containing protein n=1 Tax=Mycolicibacterium cyprinidarum TaxID=2860311 RepID=A0ABQ4V635_9MYCO|nr:hypothetical protein NGTWS1702_04410 [Mycolicibacterium sp. NGTWSNA01]GJF18986.1 hypothetical protein NGTWS0302_17600 [Mycolicibacterium sp. NGTWS0302]